MLTQTDFCRDASDLARFLLGKILRAKYHNAWLSAQIIETEAYYQDEKASHSSLGLTDKRRAMFMPAGTIYMYYSRGGDSLNISSHGDGDAVLIKSALPYFDKQSPPSSLKLMQRLNPDAQGQARDPGKICRGQTLLCRALNLKVPVWDQQQFSAEKFYIDDVGLRPGRIINTPRLGIPPGRDEHLLLRFIDYDQAAYCTRNPLRVRNWQLQRDYRIIENTDQSQA